MTDEEKAAVRGLVIAATTAYGYIRKEVIEHPHQHIPGACGGVRVRDQLREALVYWCDPESISPGYL